MSTKKYNDILKTFDEIVEKAQDIKSEAISAWAHLSLEKEHKPTMALVSFDLNHKERFNIINCFLGIEIPEEVVQMIDGDSACLILDYSETPVLLNEEKAVRNRFIFGAPYEPLKNYRVAVCDEVQSKAEWLELTGEIDIACLMVNATMAMNQMERFWMKECAAPYFSEDEIVVFITKMKQLNDEEDVQAVRKVVIDSLKRLNVSPNIFESDRDSIEWMVRFLGDKDIQDKHDKRIVKNGLIAMDAQLRFLIDSVIIDEATVESAMDQLKKQQKNLELAGKLASESILSNALNKIKLQLCDGIRDYGQQMAVNIKKKIEDSPLDQLETIGDRINGYVSGSWDYYIKSMSAKVDSEIEAITRKLTKQIEVDAGNMISELDESARRTIYSAFGLTSEMTESIVLIDQHLFIKNRNTLTEISVGTVTDQLRKETRNMMLLSIPLYFVNPLVSLGNIFVANIYGKTLAANELKKIRSEMARQIENACYENAEAMVLQVELSFDDEIRTGSINIKSAYNNLIQQIKDSLDELNKAQKEKADLKDYLKNEVEIVFPDILANL